MLNKSYEKEHPNRGVLFCNNYVIYIALFFKKILTIKS